MSNTRKPNISQQMVQVLDKSRNNEAYILYDPVLHQGMATKWISQRTFKSAITQTKKITVLAEFFDKNGAYIIYDSSVHKTLKTKSITINQFRAMGKHRPKASSIAHNPMAIIPLKYDINRNNFDPQQYLTKTVIEKKKSGELNYLLLMVNLVRDIESHKQPAEFIVLYTAMALHLFAYNSSFQPIPGFGKA